MTESVAEQKSISIRSFHTDGDRRNEIKKMEDRRYWPYHLLSSILHFLSSVVKEIKIIELKYD